MTTTSVKKLMSETDYKATFDLCARSSSGGDPLILPPGKSKRS